MDSLLARMFKQNSRVFFFIFNSFYISQSVSPSRSPNVMHRAADDYSPRKDPESTLLESTLLENDLLVMSPRRRRTSESRPLEERPFVESFPDLGVHASLTINFLQHKTNAPSKSSSLLAGLFDNDPPPIPSFPDNTVECLKPVPQPCYRRLNNIQNDPFKETRSMERIKHIPSTDTELNDRVEYDMDVQDKSWLIQINNQNNCQIEDYTLEFILNRLEKEWFQLVNNQKYNTKQ